MKTIKLASGFAVSALALAIAGQATAQTQTSLSATGEIKVQTILDIQNSQYFHSFDERGTREDEEAIFNVTINVQNGPFSGDIILGQDESQDIEIQVDNMIVSEGPVSFGQLGRVTATASLYERLTDINVRSQAAGISKEDTSTRFGIDFGLRYSVAEAGLNLQLEGNEEDSAFGVAASITQNLDVAQVWLDGQYHASVDGNDGMATDGIYNAGAAVQANLADPVVATGVFRTVSREPGDNPRTVLAAQLQIAATDQVSVRGLITDRNFSSNAGTTVARVGATVSLAPFTIMADYEALTSSMTDGFYDARVSWADGPLSAFTRVRFAQDGFDSATTNAGLLTAGASFTTASGIVYGTEYNLTEKGYLGAASGNELELYASYSF